MPSPGQRPIPLRLGDKVTPEIAIREIKGHQTLVLSALLNVKVALHDDGDGSESIFPHFVENLPKSRSVLESGSEFVPRVARPTFMQPSQYDIQREVEALRDLRRRSTSQGGPVALLDPDLPNSSSPPPSPTAYWSSASSNTSRGDSAASGSSDGAASPSARSTDDPLNLFWVPANLHPEIAPAEFRAFLKEHARAPPAEGTTALGRSPSNSSVTSLGRKRSMLSRQYRPSENESEDETVLPLQRNRSIYSNPVPQLTINDLQKLEQLAASANDDPSQLRNILRRSLSLNIPPAEIDQIDGIPEMDDDADSPIIVPPPNQILRRTARTKIRKNNLPGDGGGHRFGSSRRGRVAGAASQPSDRRLSLDAPASDPAEPRDSARRRPFSNESASEYRPESFGDDIVEAYIRDDEAEGDEGQHPPAAAPIVMDTPPPIPHPVPAQVDPPILEQPPPVFPPQPEPPVLYQPQPQWPGVRPTEESRPTQRTPSPDALAFSPPREPDLSRTSSRAQPSPSVPTPASTQRKEGEKKGFLGKWGNTSKNGKKANKDKEPREKTEKEKEPGFFVSLFSAKKRQDDSGQPFGSNASARETAHNLLGGSKSSKSQTSTSPSLAGPNGMYARYPIHVERAIYRLSHIKLANPRRPLYEQVLISNLMFWYLGVINKSQTPAAAGQGAAQPTPSAAEKDQKEKEQKEEEWAKAENERLEKENAEKERLEKERILSEQKKEPRRGSLTKPSTTASARRAAEMPVKGPQYDLQHQVMEQEYGGFMGQPTNSPMPVGRSPYVPGLGQPRMGQPPDPSPPLNAPGAYYLAGSDMSSVQGFLEQPPTPQRPAQLPPGAMPPANLDGQPAWLASQNTSAVPGSKRAGTSSLSDSSLASQRYTPPADKVRLSGRSLSATAVTPAPNAQSVNGRLRKGYSASASFSHANGTKTIDNAQGDEEDVPLAIWRQQRR